jgi:hypothetical protein
MPQLSFRPKQTDILLARIASDWVNSWSTHSQVAGYLLSRLRSTLRFRLITQPNAARGPTS